MSAFYIDEAVEERARQLSLEAKQRHRWNRLTSRYRVLRRARLEIAGHACEMCCSRRQLQLHPLHYATLGRERVGDVRILCDDCHLEETRLQRAEKRARWQPRRSRRIRLVG
jgi:hypothetical protein